MFYFITNNTTGLGSTSIKGVHPQYHFHFSLPENELSKMRALLLLLVDLAMLKIVTVFLCGTSCKCALCAVCRARWLVI